MTDHPESSRTPSGNKQVGLVPAVEAHAEAVSREDAVHLSKGRTKPIGIVVVSDTPPAALAVACNVGRVSEDKIHALALHRAHLLDAIALHDVAGRRQPGRNRHARMVARFG